MTLFLRLGASLLLMIGWACPTKAQPYKEVPVDLERLLLNGNQPLPANTPILLVAPVAVNVPWVEVEVRRAETGGNGSVLHRTVWKRPDGAQLPRFHIPLDYKFQSGKRYDIALLFFRPAGHEEADTLRTVLYGMLDYYIDQNFKYTQSSKQQHKGWHRLAPMVRDALVRYRVRTGEEFAGFSSVVQDAWHLIAHIPTEGKKAKKQRSARQAALQALKQQVHAEVNQYLGHDLYIFVDDIVIKSYLAQ